MKILLIFTFYLISGPVSCFDVIGYSGGSVIIYCTIPKNRGHDGFFCKKSRRECVNTWDHKGRVSVNQLHGLLTVIYRDLSLDDTGLYLCGETGEWNHTVDLNMKTDQCCSGPKTVIGYLGKNVTINCSYPEEFKEKPKIFYKQDFDEFTPIISTSDSQKYTSSISDTLKKRFSISDDKRSRVISGIISDVIREDEGDYYCGVSDDEGASNYETFFTKIHLQVTDSTSPSATPPAPPAPTSQPAPPVTTPSNSSVTITVSVVVVLLLIGGAALFFFIVIHKKKQGSTPSTRTNQSDQKEVPTVVSNDNETGLTIQTPSKDQNLTYSTLTPPKDQELTYSTVSFHKNPDSSTDVSVTVSKEDPETEYATVKHPKGLE